MAKFTNKISNLINQQVPEFVLEQHPKFLEFLKTYYTFMESAELGVTSVQTTDGVLLETETNQNNELILDGSRIDTDRTQLDAGDKILLESSAFGKFTRGETITGQTSNATATVLAEDLDNNRLFITAQDKFIAGEVILGVSSNASAIINNYKPNPVQNIQDLLNFRDPDKVISNFLTKFRNEFLNTLPETLSNGVDKRKLIKNVKSLYRAKGTNKGHELFFRLLFGVKSETIYPRENILRASDGKFDTKKIIRVITSVGDTSNLTGRLITGETSGATAIVENVFKFQVGANEVSELILNEDTLLGTFQISEVIRGTENDDDDIFIKATVTGIPSTISISNDGSLYNASDTVTVTGGGQGAIIQVDGIGRGGITELIIDNAGSGYEIGDELNFTNTGTGGGFISAKVSVVNGGFTQEESSSSTDDHIVLEDETTRGDSYTGNKIVQEIGEGSDDITDIRIINGGNSFKQVPSISSITASSFFLPISTISGRFKVNTSITASNGATAIVVGNYQSTNRLLLKNINGTFESSTTITGLDYDGVSKITASVTDSVTAKEGSNATIYAYGTEIGKVLGLKIIELGAGYEASPTPPTLSLPSYLIISNVSGSITTGETVTGVDITSTTVTATVVSHNSDTGVLKVSSQTGQFAENTSLTFSGGTTAITEKNDLATSSVTVGAVVDTAGAYINEDGHLSDISMRIQDSLYYQDFSYVIKVARTINDWRDSFKKTIHTSGFYFSGQVEITNRVNAKVKFPIEGAISGTSDSPLFNILNTLFSTIFGRRLGTVDDGTSLRANAHVGGNPDFDTSTISPFSSTTRDLTLSREPIAISHVSRIRRTINNVNVSQGFAYAGPRFGSLNRFANTVFGVSNRKSGITFQILNDVLVTGTRSSLDGQKGIFLMTSDENGQMIKTNFTFPCQLTFNKDETFSGTDISFDSNTINFDQTTS